VVFYFFKVCEEEIMSENRAAAAGAATGVVAVGIYHWLSD